MFKEGVTFSVSHRLYCSQGQLRCLRGRYQTPQYLSEKITSLRYVFSTNDMYEEESGVAAAFEECSEVIIVTVISTDTEAAHLSLTPEALNENKLSEFENEYGEIIKNYDKIKQRHTAAFDAYYNREAIIFDESEDMPVPDLLRECREKKVIIPEIAGKLFALSRYLCIAAGMPKDAAQYPKAPMNLQGLWNQDLYPAWDCDYHTDLNLQMCY
jgi:alpha-L-fucosidase 2